MKSCLLLLFFTVTTCAYAQDGLSDFKVDDHGKLTEWTVSPDGAVSLDPQMLYDGRPSVKFDRRDITVNTASSILRRIPINFDAQVVELRAALRAKNSGPYAGANIVLRQDMNKKPIEFINSQPFVTSTRDTDWQQVRISHKLNPRVDSLVIGSVLLGPGEAWVNDIQLWVDGELLTTLTEISDPQVTSVANNRNEIPSIDIDWSAITEHTAKDLSAFIQVWGFLKYFHPDIAIGSYDWDREFVKATQTLVMGSELNDVLMTLLEKVGVLGKQTDIERTEQGKVIATTNSRWYLDDKVFSPEVIAALTTIQSQRHSFKESKYAVSDDLAMASFTEEDYFQIGHLEQETRLLALARLWNIIEYWFPWDELPTSWYTELPDLTKQVIQSTDRSEFFYVLQRVLGQINDGHARLTDSVFRQGACRLPFTVRYIEHQVVINRLYKDLSEQDVKVGDKIVALDGESFDDLFERWLPLYSASNEPARYYGLGNELLYRSCEEATVVTIDRHTNQREVSISEYETIASPDHSLPGDVVQTLDDDVTYLKVAGVDFAAVDEALESAQQSGKLIIDVRGYPSEFILYYLGGRLTQEPLPFAQLARVHPQFPGSVTLIDYLPTLEPYDPVLLNGIAILVDETTLSQSEFSVLAWRELPNAQVIGSTTAGAVGNVSRVPLPNGMQAYFTGLRVLDKEGRDVQYTGIVPDIYIKPTIADLQNGRDVVIDKAIEWLGSVTK
ncbi:hypothetical protein CWE22_07695 [Pseudidiomarina aestuarii]|uniref:Tail specific protease domain-containing protein n=1 Tax=Pseudidiomarina aestuarii TaxID=624146 RepID=A0A7Z6ZVK7_9GAMM|nr:S41 family peptidase [Pseudidiomarina aestuarii]RUO42016.1 hypothetical protein CWE22_07695 [Pseudidiomarina aestuarii]